MKYYGIPVLDEFLYEKFNEGLSPLSLRDYRTMLNLLLSNPIFSFSDYSTFSELNLKIFLGNLLQERNWKAQTYNRVKKNMKVFFDFLVQKGFFQENPLQKIKNRKLEKTLPKFLNKDKVRLIQKYLFLIKQDRFILVRDKTILYFYLYTGIRLSELIHLKIDDVNYLEKYIVVRKGKGNKERIVPLVSPLSQYVLDYYFYRVRSAVKSDFLFPTLYGNKLQPREIYKPISTMRESLGFKITPHMFRHTFATELVKQNINLYDVSMLLGHSNLNTTKIYLNLDIESVTRKLSLVNLYS